MHKQHYIAIGLLAVCFVFLRLELGPLAHSQAYLTDGIALLLGFAVLHLFWLVYDDDKYATLMLFGLWLFLFLPLLYNILSSLLLTFWQALFGQPKTLFLNKIFYFLSLLPAVFFIGPLALPFIYFYIPDRYVMRAATQYTIVVSTLLAAVAAAFYPTQSAVFWITFTGLVVVAVFGLLAVSGYVISKGLNEMISVGIEVFAMVLAIGLTYKALDIVLGMAIDVVRGSL